MKSRMEKLIDEIFWLNLQNLSGREDFQEAFREGIRAAVEHLTLSEPNANQESDKEE